MKSAADRARCKAYYEANKERVLARMREKYWADHAGSLAKAKARRQRDPEKFRKWAKDFRMANAGRVREYNERRWAACLIEQARLATKIRGRAKPTITAEYVEELWRAQGGRCAWTGVPMDHKANSPWKASIDRRDNSRGYEPGNVILAAWMVNRGRHRMPEAEFGTALKTLATALLASQLEVER